MNTLKPLKVSEPIQMTLKQMKNFHFGVSLNMPYGHGEQLMRLCGIDRVAYCTTTRSGWVLDMYIISDLVVFSGYSDKAGDIILSREKVEEMVEAIEDVDQEDRVQYLHTMLTGIRFDYCLPKMTTKDHNEA